MRSLVAAAALLALAVVLFSDGARTLFATPALYAPSMTGQVAGPVYSQPASYAAPIAQTPPVHVAPAAERDGLSHIAMLAVVGAIAGVAVGSAMKRNPQQEMADATAIIVPDIAGPIAALAVAGYKKTAAREDLEKLATKLNPALGFFDPLNLSEANFWGEPDSATIGFLRHAEIKHGRVAMAGFVGFMVHANGIHFPWHIPGDEMCAAGVSPPLLWQSLPYEAKAQIILTIGLFEWYSESAQAQGKGMGGHYMRGGKPGFFPPFVQRNDNMKGFSETTVGRAVSGAYLQDEAVTNERGDPLLPHPVPYNLYDPFGLNKNKSEEWKAEKLTVEINNGRLAMIGLMGCLSEGAIPGSVPFLKGLIPVSGEINVMRPFDFTQPFEPFIPQVLNF